MKLHWLFLGILLSLNCHAQNMAVIDNGLNNDHYARFDSLIRNEGCVSEYADNSRPSSGVFSDTESIRYNTVSVCRNGGTLQYGGKGTSTLPRAVIGERYNSLYFYTWLPADLGETNHGAYMLEAARTVGANANQIYNVMSMRFEKNHSDTYTSPSNFKLFRPRSSTDLRALQHIASIKSREGISVVSYSRGFDLFSSGCTGIFDAQIRRLHELDVLVVAATGRDANYTQVAYPSCSNSVVSVAGLRNDSNFSVLGNSNVSTGLDFFANGVVDPVPALLLGQRAGSSAATARVATYLGRLKIRNPSRRMFDIWQAFEQAADNKVHPRNTNVVANIADNVSFLAADRLLKTNQGGSPTTETLPYPPVPVLDMNEYVFGEVNTGAYGNGYGSNLHPNGYAVNILLSEVALTTASTAQALQRTSGQLTEKQLLTKASTSCGAKYKFRYKIWDIDYDAEVRVYLNNAEIAYVTATGNGQLKSRKIEFCGNLLKAGKNKFEFRLAAANRKWGVRDIALEFVDKGKINVDVGKLHTGSYGYGFGSNEHRSQLLVNFALNNNNKDIELSVKGWDIDLADENKVYINNRLLGYLSKGCSSCFNGGDTFTIPANVLVTGVNEIAFIQRNPDTVWRGFQNEKWGVRDILVREKNGDIVPILKLLLLDD